MTPVLRRLESKNRSGLPVSAKTLLAALPFVLGMVLLGAFALRGYLKQALGDSVKGGLQNELILIEQAVENAFLEEDFADVQKIVTNLSYQGQLEIIRILNKQGQVLASSAPGEVGIQMDLSSDACQPCHGEQGPLPNFSEPAVDVNGSQP